MIRLALMSLVSLVGFRVSTAFEMGERPRGDRVADFGLDQALHFSGDSHNYHLLFG